MKFLSVALVILFPLLASANTTKLEIAIFTDFGECFILPDDSHEEVCTMWIDYRPNQILEVGKEVELDHSQLNREIKTTALINEVMSSEGKMSYLLKVSSYDGGKLIIGPIEYPFLTPQDLKNSRTYGNTIELPHGRSLKPFLYVSQPWEVEELP